MNDQELDLLLRRIAEKTKPANSGKLQAQVWQALDRRPGWRASLSTWLAIWGGALARRAAPAAFALIVGGVSGAAMAQSDTQDDLAIFDTNSSFSLVSGLLQDTESN